jgi:hypothetical protein
VKLRQSRQTRVLERQEEPANQSIPLALILMKQKMGSVFPHPQLKNLAQIYLSVQ